MLYVIAYNGNGNNDTVQKEIEREKRTSNKK